MFHILTVVYNLNGKLTIGNDNSLNAHFLAHHFLDFINTGTIVIGRKTWFSIDQHTRNKFKSVIVLTNDKTLWSNSTQNVLFSNENFKKSHTENYYICGGIDIINQYMKTTEISNYYFAVLNNYFVPDPDECYIKIPLQNNIYIKSVSEIIYDKKWNLSFRLMNLSKSPNETHYEIFFKHYKTLLENSCNYIGMNCEFNVQYSIPLIGNLNYKKLKEVFIDKLKGNTFYDTSDKTPWNWRFLNADYSYAFADTSIVDRSAIGGIDQFDKLDKQFRYFKQSNENSLNSFVFSINKDNFMNNCFVDIGFQVCVFKNEISICVFLKECDYLLEFPKLLFEYSLLLHILSKKYSFIPKKVCFYCGNMYLQKDINISFFEQYLPSPLVTLNNSLVYKTLNEIKIEDILLIGLHE